MEKELNDAIIHVKKGETEYFQFKRLLEYSDKINHAFGVKPNGYRTSNCNQEGINSYKTLCDAIGEDYHNLVKPGQVHGNLVGIVEGKIIDEPDIKSHYGNDGLTTNKQNIILGTTNADCILIIFYDPVKNVIANIHSGWRGTFRKISVQAIKKMVKAYGCNPKDIICAICPSIRSCHFEVQADVKNQCCRIFRYTGKLQEIIRENVKGKTWNIDLIEITKILLKETGVQEENIIDSGICSVCHSDMVHSYRVDRELFNLNTAIITLK